LIEGEISSILAPPVAFFRSLDQSIRPSEHLRRNYQADLLRRLEIDDEVELLGPIHRYVSGFCPLENFYPRSQRRAGTSLNDPGNITPSARPLVCGSKCPVATSSVIGALFEEYGVVMKYALAIIQLAFGLALFLCATLPAYLYG